MSPFSSAFLSVIYTCLWSEFHLYLETKVLVFKKKKNTLMWITLIKKGNINGFILLTSLFLAWRRSALLSSLTGTSPARLRLVAHKALVSLWKCSWRWWLRRACSRGTTGRKIYSVLSRKIKHLRGVEDKKKSMQTSWWKKELGMVLGGSN